MRSKPKPRVAVCFNRDYESGAADPENRAREEVRDVADRVLEILAHAGFDARPVGVTEDVFDAIEAVRELGPTLVFNLCESIGGDNRFETLLPTLLDLEGIAYTGSSPLALALALHKNKAKDVLRAAGVPVPRGLCVLGGEVPAAAEDLRYPLMVKPAREDASVGISKESVVRDRQALAERVRFVFERYRQPAIVEEFIEGREINASLLARQGGPPDVLPLHEIDFSDMPGDRPRIVSFEGKWVEGSPEYRGTRPVPCAGLDDAVRARVAEVARLGFAAMELRDYGRLDFRLAQDGTPYVIDVNPNCDLSDEAGFARAAAAAGIAYADVILHIADLALSRRLHADPISLATRSRRARGAHRRPEPHAEPLPPGGGVLRARAPRRGAGTA